MAIREGATRPMPRRLGLSRVSTSRTAQTTHLAHRPMADGPHSQGRPALPTKRAEWPTISDGARRDVATRRRAPAPPAGMVIP